MTSYPVSVLLEAVSKVHYPGLDVT